MDGETPQERGLQSIAPMVDPYGYSFFCYMQSCFNFFYKDFWDKQNFYLHLQQRKYIKCMNCDRLFDNSVFNNHICDHDQNKNFIHDDQIAQRSNLNFVSTNTTANEIVAVKVNENMVVDDENVRVIENTNTFRSTPYSSEILGSANNSAFQRYNNTIPKFDLNCNSRSEVRKCLNCDLFFNSFELNNHNCNLNKHKYLTTNNNCKRKAIVISNILIKKSDENKQELCSENMETINTTTTMNKQRENNDNNNENSIIYNNLLKGKNSTNNEHTNQSEEKCDCSQNIDEQYSTPNEVNEQNEITNKKNGLRQCNICKAVFTSKVSALMHCTSLCFKTELEETRLQIKNKYKPIKYINTENMYQCDSCSFIFTNIKSLLIHSNLHLDKKYFECKECNIFMIDSYEKISNHWKYDCKLRNYLVYAVFMCNICGTNWKDLNQLFEHRFTSHSVYFDEKLLKITEHKNSSNCDKEIEIHENSEKVQEAEINNSKNKKKKKFNENENLQTIETNLSVKAIKVFNCNYCNRLYSIKTVYLLHQLDHLILTCYFKTCKHIKFKTPSSLIEHKLQFHKENIKICPFEKCPKRVFEKDYKKHYNDIHVGVTTYKTNLVYCKICNLFYPSWAAISHAYLTHNTKDMFYCPTCNKFFKMRILEKHLLNHSMKNNFF